MDTLPPIELEEWLEQYDVRDPFYLPHVSYTTWEAYVEACKQNENQ